VNVASDEVAFYRSLTSALIRDIENNGQGKSLDLSEIDDKAGCLQLTISTKDRRKDLAVLNFSGSAPFLHLDGIAYQLQVVARDSAILRDKQLGAQEIADWIGKQIAEELKRPVG
jgi:hypothetical protein